MKVDLFLSFVLAMPSIGYWLAFSLLLACSRGLIWFAD
jgi:hypothetical protein